VHLAFGLTTHLAATITLENHLSDFTPFGC